MEKSFLPFLLYAKFFNIGSHVTYPFFLCFIIFCTVSMTDIGKVKMKKLVLT